MDKRDYDRFQDALAGRYVVRRELGRGGAALVFLADDIRHQRAVAIKVPRPDLFASLSVKRFLREIALASTLDHPNLLPVLETGEADGLPFYVMPYINEGSLYDEMRREGALRMPRVLEIVTDVAAALDYAHAKGIVHRDIKPENVLFRDGRAAVADFGIAKAFAEAGGERLTESGVAIGTPRYMSPEQAGNDRLIDGRSDVYSLGCLTFEMIAGEPPFTGASTKAIIAKQMVEPPPKLTVLRPTVTVETQGVIERALAKTPADRYATAGDFARALRLSFAGVTARRRRVLRGAAGSAVAVAVLAASGWIWTRISAPAAADDGAEAARRIAVLYFEDLSPDRRLSHIAAGLTEDLIDRLSQVEGLHVISPNGVRPFRDTVVPTDTLARRLGVGTLIAGGVGASGPLLRLSVRLIDARSGTQLRNRSVQVPSWDLFKLQDSVNGDVSVWLREHLGRQIRLRELQQTTRSVAAWEALHRGEALANQSAALVRAADAEAAPALSRAVAFYEEAQRLDRSWSEPVVRRARAMLVSAFLSPDAREGAFERAISLADEALRRRPPPPEAYAVRGEARLRLYNLGGKPDGVLDSAVADLERAASLRRDQAHTWYLIGEARYARGDFRQATEAYNAAYRADAFLTEMPAVTSGLFQSWLHAEALDEATRWCSFGQTRYPSDPRFLECDLRILAQAARSAEDAGRAWLILERIEADDRQQRFRATWKFRRMMVAAALARAGLRDSARAALARANHDIEQRPKAAAAEAYVRLLLGERDAALRLLGDEIRRAPHMTRHIARTPWFRGLHEDARFRALVHDHVSEPSTLSR